MIGAVQSVRSKPRSVYRVKEVVFICAYKFQIGNLFARIVELSAVEIFVCDSVVGVHGIVVDNAIERVVLVCHARIVRVKVLRQKFARARIHIVYGNVSKTYLARRRRCVRHIHIVAVNEKGETAHVADELRRAAFKIVLIEIVDIVAEVQFPVVGELNFRYGDRRAAHSMFVNTIFFLTVFIVDIHKRIIGNRNIIFVHGDICGLLKRKILLVGSGKEQFRIYPVKGHGGSRLNGRRHNRVIRFCRKRKDAAKRACRNCKGANKPNRLFEFHNYHYNTRTRV